MSARNDELVARITDTLNRNAGLVTGELAGLDKTADRIDERLDRIADALERIAYALAPPIPLPAAPPALERLVEAVEEVAQRTGI